MKKIIKLFLIISVMFICVRNVTAKDYVKDNDKCLSYLSLKMESKLNEYEIYSAVGGNEKEIDDETTSVSTLIPILISNSTEGQYSNANISNFCNEGRIIVVFRFFGYLLYAAKILVPILLIVFGVIDYIKALISSDQNMLSKSTQSLITRLIAGVVIFLIPTIVNFTFSLVSNSKVSDMNNCRKCFFNPRSC